MLVRVNLTFFPQHFLGLAGMPRRIPDYPDAFAFWNSLSTLGAVFAFLSTIYFVFLIWEALASQRPLLASRRRTASAEWKELFPLPAHTNPERIKITWPGQTAA
jgi:cytochrome c oxidase subunit 1